MPMKKTRFFAWFATLLLLLQACTDDTALRPPKIRLSQGSNYTYKDTIGAPGQSFLTGIECTGTDNNLTNFIIQLNGQRYFDTGINTPNLYLNKAIIKGLDPTEEVEFIIRDKEGQSASTAFVLSLDPSAQFGPVEHLGPIRLGAQNNNTESFFALSTASAYTLEAAFNVQDIIDLVYYFDAEEDKNTLASPGANIASAIFPGPYGLDQWNPELKRTSRFKSTDINLTTFQSLPNDSLLLAAYGTTIGKRKAKLLSPGDTYVFNTHNNRKGLFYVHEVIGEDTGEIELSIVIQQKNEN